MACLAIALELFHSPKAYNCFLDACIECNAMPKALEVLEDMKLKGLADVVSYNTVMTLRLLKRNFNCIFKWTYLDPYTCDSIYILSS